MSRLRRRGLDRLVGPIGIRLRRHRGEVLAAARAAGVRVHGVFGSVPHGEDRPDSDVDLLVDLPDRMGLFGLARLQEQLQAILDARVELIPAADLKPGVRPAALADLVPL